MYVGDVLDALLKNSVSGRAEDDENRYIWLDVFFVDKHKSTYVDCEKWMTTIGMIF